jgi:hypothetical protein
MGTQATTPRRSGNRVARRLAGVVAAAALFLVAAPGTATATPTNPSDAQITQAQQAKADAAQQVGALSAALADAQVAVDAARARSAIALDTFQGKQAEYEAAQVTADEAAATAQRARDDLAAARAASGLPVLRKDFTVSQADVLDARTMGADAVLLIVAALTDRELDRFRALAAALGLAALVEVHDEEELDRALAAGADLIGVNQRDLRTFDVDRTLAARLVARIPAAVVTVAESGIRTRADIPPGVDAVLVGETLVTSSDPTAAIRELRGAQP